MSVIYCCKQCGRSGRFDEKPNWCYFDRCDSIENVSDEDAVKMGLDIPDDSMYEFVGDVRWHPMTGERIANAMRHGKTLREFQENVMKGVRDQ